MKFRKKPIVIDAFQLTETNFKEAYEFLGENVDLYMPNDGTFINIKTLEGAMQARIGDYIIKGVKGEFYPCKPDIFEQTYAAIEMNENKMEKWEYLKKDIAEWKDDAQTEEEYIVLCTVLEKINYIEKKFNCA